MANTASPPSSSPYPGSKAELRALVHGQADAVRANNAAVMMRNYAEDVAIFGVVPPVHLRGAPPVVFARSLADGW